MSLLGVTRTPREIDGSHIQCHRCGIIKRRSGRKPKPPYICQDCAPYWNEAAE